mmetsp:Transcript_149312/g.479471  ORF Transcript_149312/g.479471 Transcript_149312/m.479471 type:complete len:233 (+) Transcript_149312:1381-2079(+)
MQSQRPISIRVHQLKDDACLEHAAQTPLRGNLAPFAHVQGLVPVNVDGVECCQRRRVCLEHPPPELVQRVALQLLPSLRDREVPLLVHGLGEGRIGVLGVPVLLLRVDQAVDELDPSADIPLDLIRRGSLDEPDHILDERVVVGIPLRRPLDQLLPTRVGLGCLAPCIAEGRRRARGRGGALRGRRGGEGCRRGGRAPRAAVDEEAGRPAASFLRRHGARRRTPGAAPVGGA